MTDSEKLDKLMSDVADLKGSVRTLTALHGNTEKQVSKLEGRVWGLVIAVGGAFGTSLMSLIMGKVAGSPHTAQITNTAREVFAALIQ